MSHKASNWLASLPAKSLTAGAFRVLFHLCDAHNSSQAPEYACFPSQELLREKTGMSNSGLNNVLITLENDGFIGRRRTRTADGAKKQTYYILGCDQEALRNLTPQSGVSPNSTFEGGLTPLEEQSLLHSRGDKPVKEPVREPVSSAREGASKPTPRSALEKVLTPELAEEVIQHRNRIRKPMTALAASLLAEEFAKVDNPNHGAKIMIKNGWQGFKPSWYENAVKSDEPGQRPQKAKTVSEVFGQLADQMERQAS